MGKQRFLTALETYLADEYEVISLSFEGLGDASFKDEKIFCEKFLKNIDLFFHEIGKVNVQKWYDEKVVDFDLLNQHLTMLCQGKKVVLMIDDVDKASNYRIFIG